MDLVSMNLVSYLVSVLEGPRINILGYEMRLQVNFFVTSLRDFPQNSSYVYLQSKVKCSSVCVFCCGFL
jgi:hypothetical protein